MSEKIKNILWSLLAIGVVVVCGVMFIFDDFEHIEDTNGSSISLNTITNQDIIEDEMASKGMKYSKTNFELAGIQLGGISFYSDTFSGVEELFYADYILPSDFSLSLTEYEISSGNFKLVVVNNGKIIAEVEPGLSPYVEVRGITGYTSIRAVGESASFSFKMTQTEFDDFTHPQWD